MQENISHRNKNVYDKQHIDVLKRNVYIPNELVEAEYHQFTLDDYRTTIFIFSKIKKEIHIPKNDIVSFIQHYTLLSKVLETLKQKSIILENGESIRIIDEINIRRNTISIKINQKLYHMFQQTNYTSLDLVTVLKFRHKYSIKLYIMLARFLDTGWRRDSIEDFRKKLSVSGKYEKWKDIKKRVLEPAVKEIEKYANMKIHYEYRKTYIHFEFEKFEEQEKEKEIEAKKKEYIEKLFEQEFLSYLEREHNLKNAIAVYKSMSQKDIEMNVRMLIKRATEDVPEIKDTIKKLFQKDMRAAFLYLVCKNDERKKIISAVGMYDVR